MQNVIIREMTPSDWPEVECIYSQSLRKGTASFTSRCPSYDEWDAAHIKSCRLVSLENDKITGFAAISPISSKPHYSGVAEVSIYVDEQHLRKGIGNSLLLNLCSKADSCGFWTLYSSIFSENIASIELHKKCGFRIIGFRDRIAKNIFGKWQSTTIMERRNDIE